MGKFAGVKNSSVMDAINWSDLDHATHKEYIYAQEETLSTEESKCSCRHTPLPPVDRETLKANLEVAIS